MTRRRAGAAHDGTGASPKRAAATKPAFGSAWLSRRLHTLIPEFTSTPMAVALSGGEDSVALLVAAGGMQRGRGRGHGRERGRAPLRAIHVDHGLQAASAQFVEACTVLCARLEIPLMVVRAQLTGARGESLEAAARAARYRAFESVLERDEQLLLAHHADDQLETVILQMLRGAGVAGLAAMPEKARCGEGFVVRPLLSLCRSALREFLESRGVEAIRDPMNSDLRFDRNFLRLEILPKLMERWPGATAAAGRSARHAAEAQRLLTELGERDVAQITDGNALTVQGLRALDPARRRNALRVFISREGLPLPDTSRLNELAGAMLEARADAAPVVQWKGVKAVRDSQRLVLQRASSALPGQTAATARSAETVWNWKTNRRMVLAAVPGILALEDDAHGPLDLTQLPSALRIDWRRGGERLRPRRGGPSRTLKSLLQSAGLPHSDRATLPLIYAGERLIAVADRWSDASVQALPSSVLRGRLSWTVNVRDAASMC